MSIVEELKQLATVDLFTDVKDLSTFVGRPFYFDYTSLKLLANDAWKQRVGGIPAGALLVAVYDNEEDLPEVVLLRVLGPTPLPTDSDVVAAIVDYYKENAPTDAVANRLDSYTRYEFQFSGLECRVLGSFYRTSDRRTAFGADIDNFYSPNNYSVYKPRGRVLEYLGNFREDEGIPGGEGDVRIGEVRYSSSRHHLSDDHVPVYVSSVDFLGKRTALFGMTRTGKSNTLKKIVQATMDLSPQGAKLDGKLIDPIGQIIFDVNGEYANDNQQDEGTAIYQLFGSDVTRYSLLEKPGFKVMKFNFYTHLAEGYSLIQTHLVEDSSRYTQAFLNLSWEEPDTSDHGATARYNRRLACYKCILHAAGFIAPRGSTVKFQGNATINGWVNELDPNQGLTLDEATI